MTNTKAFVDLSAVITELVEERDLDRSVLSDIVIEGMLAAYAKKYPELELRVQFNKKTGELEVEANKEVVSAVENELSQISMRKARAVSRKAEIGGKVWVPFEGAIGRVEILKAKQVIAQKIRSVEALAVYNAFKDKQNTIVQGTLYKHEHAGALVKLQDALAFLPKSLMIPGEKHMAGYSVKALLKEVLPEPRNDNQLILDRASSDFLRRLFELEIPEVFEGLVEIKKIIRDPGYKSKVLVASHDPNIDPVGTCVGMGGARIKPILKEISSEKIDIIAMTSSQDELVKHALKPAEINRVEVFDGVARVWLDDEQRSLAIGKMGKNIALASALTGLTIELVDNIAGASKEFSFDSEQKD